jgi:hypothetical protein
VHPFQGKRGGANGKNFISVNVGSPGGLGVAIALLLSLTDPLSKIRYQNQIFCYNDLLLEMLILNAVLKNPDC